MELLNDRKEVTTEPRGKKPLENAVAPSKTPSLDSELRKRVESLAKDALESLPVDQTVKFSIDFGRDLKVIASVAEDIQSFASTVYASDKGEIEKQILHKKIQSLEQRLTVYAKQTNSINPEDNPFIKLSAICKDLDQALRETPQQIRIEQRQDLKAGDILSAENRRILFLDEPLSSEASVDVLVYDTNSGSINIAKVTPNTLLQELGSFTVQRHEAPQLIPTAPLQSEDFVVAGELPPLQIGDHLHRIDYLLTADMVSSQIVAIDSEVGSQPVYSMVELVDDMYKFHQRSHEELSDPSFGLSYGMHEVAISPEEHSRRLAEATSIATLLEKHFSLSSTEQKNLAREEQARAILAEVPPGAVIIHSDGTRSLFLGLNDPEGARRLVLSASDGTLVETVSESECLGENAQISNRYLYPGKRERYDVQSLKWTDIGEGDVFIMADGSKKEILRVERGINSTRAWVDSIHYLPNGTIEILRGQESCDLDLHSSALQKQGNSGQFVSAPIRSVGLRTEHRQSADTGYFKHPLQNSLASMCFNIEEEAARIVLKETVARVQRDYMQHRSKQSPAEQSPVDKAVHAGDQYLHDIHRRSEQFQGQFTSFLLDFVQEQGGFMEGKLALTRAFQQLSVSGNKGEEPIGCIRDLLTTLKKNLPKNTSWDAQEKLERTIQRFNHMVELLPVDSLDDSDIHRTELPLEGEFVVLNRSNITAADLRQLMAIEQQKPGTPGSRESESRGIITVKSTEEFLLEQLDEGMEIIAYRGPGEGGSNIKAFFNYYPAGKLSPELREKYTGVYEKLDSVAYLDLYAISDDLQEHLRSWGVSGLMSTCLFAAHSHRGQARGTELLIGQIEQQNIPSLVTVLGELGVPNTYDVHVKHPGKEDESVWVSFAVPASPQAKETFREYAGDTRPSRSKLIAQIKENARTTRVESRYIAQMREAPGDKDLRLTIGAGNMNERQFDRMMEYFQHLEGYDGRMHLGGSEMIKRNTVNPDAPIRTKRNIYEMQCALRSSCPDAQIGNIIMIPENGETKTITNEAGQKEVVRVISSDEAYETIVLRNPEVAAAYEVSEVDWDLETKKAKELALRLHNESLENSDERDRDVPFVITGWEGGRGILKELCDYARTPLEGGIDLIIIPESGGANQKFYEAYQRHLDGDPEFADFLDPGNRIHIAHSPEEFKAITESLGLQERKEAHEFSSMSLSRELASVFA